MLEAASTLNAGNVENERTVTRLDRICITEVIAASRIIHQHRIGKRLDVSDEIQPYVVYRIDGEQMEFALWQFKNGPKALALFLSGDSATVFQAAANLGDEWKIFCPTRPALLQILKGGFEAGVAHAVLDPDLEKAKRIFNIQEILDAVGEQWR